MERYPVLEPAGLQSFRTGLTVEYFHFARMSDVGVAVGEVEEVGDESDPQRPQVLQVEDCQTIRASRRRVFAAFDGLHGVRDGERGEIGVERVISFDISYYFTRIRIILIVADANIVFTKIIGYCFRLSHRGLIKELNWLIRWSLSPLSR